MNANAISALNGEIIYYQGYKVGSTTIRTWINLMNSPELRTTHPDLYDSSYWRLNKEQGVYFHKDKAELHKKDLIYLPKTNYKALNGRSFDMPVVPDNNKVRFCIVRDPVERFISGFANRVVREKETGDLTINGFIDNFDYYYWKFQNVESHFAPQTYTYGQDPNIYTNIYNIRQMPEVKKMLESYSGPLPDISINKTTDEVKQTLKLTDDQIALIKKKYAIDYEVFGKWFQ
jgi:Sulfotransferase family